MDKEPRPIAAPADYVAESAVTFADEQGDAVLVDREHPLPVRNAPAAAESTPLQGMTGASGVFGPFIPDLGRAVELRLSGEWTGHVTVKDSIDDGATLLPLTVGGQPWGGPYTGNVNEEAVKTPHVAGQTLWIDAALESGTLNYWMGQ